MIFNRKFWKIVKWLLVMKKKHNIYSFRLICSKCELIIYVEGSESIEDELRIPIF